MHVPSVLIDGTTGGKERSSCSKDPPFHRLHLSNSFSWILGIWISPTISFRYLPAHRAYILGSASSRDCPIFNGLLSYLILVLPYFPSPQLHQPGSILPLLGLLHHANCTASLTCRVQLPGSNTTCSPGRCGSFSPRKFLEPHLLKG